jgi:lipoprotein NlpI
VSTSAAEANPARQAGSRWHRNAAALAALIALGLPLIAAGQGQQSPATVMDKAVSDFFAARIPESVASFDRLAAMVPNEAPELWQRGIALYYAGRYADCRKQFESHRTVNPDDVENAVWHFLCVARAESPERARAALLPVGPDSRVPMREVYRMFQGTLTPDNVLAAGGKDGRPRFYAVLYVGLYHEAMNGIDTDPKNPKSRASLYITEAASDSFASVGGYMNRVAKVHASVRGWKKQ